MGPYLQKLHDYHGCHRPRDPSLCDPGYDGCAKLPGSPSYPSASPRTWGRSKRRDETMTVDQASILENDRHKRVQTAESALSPRLSRLDMLSGHQEDQDRQ